MKTETKQYCTIGACEVEAVISVKRIVGGCEIAVPLCSNCADAFNWGQETGFTRAKKLCEDIITKTKPSS